MVSIRVTSEAEYAPVFRILRLYTRVASSVDATVGETTLLERDSLGYPTGGGMGPAANTFSDVLRANATTVATIRIPMTIIVINWIAFFRLVLISFSLSDD
jgi:hypothetical protein